MATLCFLSVFIGYAYSKNIYCYNASECAGDIDIGSDRGDTVYGYGYKSLFQSTSSTTNTRYCDGALSCKETPYIYCLYYLYCDGTYSCSNTAYITNILNYIYGYGANSLMNTHISIEGSVACSGDKSCANSTISSIHGLSARGALSLFATTINITSRSGTFHAYFEGYYAGYQAAIHCEAGSVCYIYCGYNGCGGLSLICDDNAQCNIINESIFALSPNTGLKLNAKEILFWNSTQITTTNEDQCSKQIPDKTFDNYQQHYMGKDLIYTTNVGPICCRAELACSYSLISYDSNGASVVCSGEYSCYFTEIISNSNDLMVECSASYACFYGSIAGNGGTVYCYGYYSCAHTTITKISHIYCTGLYSCDDTIITSAGINITVYLTGHESGTYASITCNETDHCTILCDAYQACDDVSLYCDGTCFVACNKDTGCPNGWTANPTSKPTSKPTSNPTTNPTSNVTTKQRVNTKAIIIIAVAVCAFFGTICVFRYMNKKKGANCNALDVLPSEQETGTDNNTLTELLTSQSIQMVTYDSNNYKDNKNKYLLTHAIL